MDKKTISTEVLERVKTLPRLDYIAFQLLVTQKQVKCFIRFTKPKTIFFDEESGYFLYLNPYHLALQKCGEFITESEVDNG